jgi:transposase-like protein
MMTKFKSLFDLLNSSPTEQDCIDYFKERRWNNKVVSPFDPTSQVYECANNRYRCKNTNKYFNVKTKTVFENSKIPLLKWFWALYFLSSNKKGISSCQLAEHVSISVTQKTAWFMLHRLRRAFKCSLFNTMLGNNVEADETYLGGSNSNRHWNKKVPNSQGRSWKDKTPILVIIERGGNVIAQVVPNVRQNTLEPIIRTNVKEGSNVYTDEWFAYNGLKKWFNHQIVNHRIKQYVNGDASTNSAENFNSCLKRGIDGTYHHVSRKHTQKYVNEVVLRYNTRKYNQSERFDLVLLSSVGKRLTYQQLIN